MVLLVDWMGWMDGSPGRVKYEVPLILLHEMRHQIDENELCLLITLKFLCSCISFSFDIQ